MPPAQNDSESYRQNKQRVEKQSQNYSERQQHDDPINCPLIFKACLVTLLAGGMLAFVVTFTSLVKNPLNLDANDFISCPKSGNLKRLSHIDAYETIILGLSISGLIFAFGIAIFLIMHAYNYCRCYDGCCSSLPEEQQQSVGQEINMNQYTIQLKKQITANIVKPRGQGNTINEVEIIPKIKSQLSPQKNKSSSPNVKNLRIRKFLKSKEHIKQIQDKYGSVGQCDCECDDIGQCLGFCVGCMWCRTCFQAHHYHFYKTKEQEYAYWIIYLVKTLFFGAALAYLIMIYVTLQNLNYCSTNNAKSYANELSILMIIGITTAAVDVFGYIHLFVQGSLLDLVEDTLNQKRKSENSVSDSQDEHQNDHNTQSLSQNGKDKKKNQKKSKKLQLYQERDSFQNQQASKNRLLTSLAISKKNQQDSLKKQTQYQAKDTDSFFINLRTMGKKYLDNIDDQDNECQNVQKPSKMQKNNVIKAFQEHSQTDINKKPQIKIPLQMQRQLHKNVKTQKQQPQQKSQYFQKTQGFGFNQEKKQTIQDKVQQNKEAAMTNKYQRPSFGGGSKFGAFNRDPEKQEKYQNQNKNQNQNKTPNENQDKSLYPMQNLSKYSTKF